MKPKVLLTDAGMNMLGSVMDNVILTPHFAYFTQEADARLDRDALEAALAILQGQRPKHVKNPEVFENDSKI
jgi:phosphoglycerate dehydrogenase-like enzyme